MKYPYRADESASLAQSRYGREDIEGDAARVVRGGSWVNPHSYARCACRDDSDVDTDLADVGLCVVCAPV